MVVLLLLTVLVVVIPALHLINTKYVQRIALFVGASQIALLAFNGKIDKELSDFLINSFNHVVSFSFGVIIQKVCLLLFNV